MEHQFVNCASCEKFKNLPEILKKMAKSAISNPKDLVNNYPITQTNISLELADSLVTLVRSNLTNDCYDTHETVSDDEKLLDNTKPWFILERYKDKLMELADNNFKVFSELIETDISFRLKRCQGYQWIYFSDSNDVTHAIVFDITFSR